MGIMGHVCFGGDIYDYGGYVFEFHNYLGPTLLRRDTHEPWKVQPMTEKHGFWSAFKEWQKLDNFEKEKTIVYQGGCMTCC